MTKVINTLLIGSLFLTLSFVAMADEYNQAFDRARSLLLSGQTSEAERLFVELLQSDAVSAKQKMKILTLQRGHDVLLRKKREIAERLLAKKHCDRAEVLFRELQPFAAYARIANQGLDRCQKYGRYPDLSASASVEASLGHDSNPLRISDEPITDGRQATLSSDFQQAAVSGSLNFRMSPLWRLSSTVRWSQTRYQETEAQQYDQQSYYLSTQLRYRPGRTVDLYWPLKWRSVEYQDEPLLQWYSAGVGLRSRQGSIRQQGRVEWRQRRYHQLSDQVLNSAETRALYSFNVNTDYADWRLQLHGRLRSGTDQQRYDYRQAGVTFSSNSRETCWQAVCLTGQLQWRGQRRDYLAEQPGDRYFERVDYSRTLAAEARLNWQSWRWRVEVSQQQRHSTLDSEEYRRYVFETALRYRF